MKIGFIGVGNVGGKLAGSLIGNGYSLSVRDLDRSQAEPLLQMGASWGESGRSMAVASDVIITCLPSPAVSAQVMEEPDGVIEGLSSGKIWLEMSSTDADEIRRLGALVKDQGAIAMDCPVSGGCHRAATGNIAIFAGGERTAFERVLPMLAALGRDILHTGPLGSASIMKVTTNYLAGVHLVATGEAFMVAKKAGIALDVAYEAIRISSGNSFTHETEGQLILNGSYNVNFTLDHEVKDLTLFDELGKKHDISLELSPLCVAIMHDALDRYGPRAWSTMVVKRLEDECGIDLRAAGFPAYLNDTEDEAEGAEILVGNRAGR